MQVELELFGVGKKIYTKIVKTKNKIKKIVPKIKTIPERDSLFLSFS